MNKAFSGSICSLLILGLLTGCSTESNKKTTPLAPVPAPAPAQPKNPDALPAAAVSKLISSQNQARAVAGNADVQACSDNLEQSQELVSCLATAMLGVGRFYENMLLAYQSAQGQAKGGCLSAMRSFSKQLAISAQAHRSMMGTLQKGFNGQPAEKALQTIGSIPPASDPADMESRCSIQPGTLWMPDVS